MNACRRHNYRPSSKYGSAAKLMMDGGQSSSDEKSAHCVSSLISGDWPSALQRPDASCRRRDQRGSPERWVGATRPPAGEGGGGDVTPAGTRLPISAGSIHRRWLSRQTIAAHHGLGRSSLTAPSSSSPPLPSPRPLPRAPIHLFSPRRGGAGGADGGRWAVGGGDGGGRVLHRAPFGGAAERGPEGGDDLLSGRTRSLHRARPGQQVGAPRRTTPTGPSESRENA